MEIISFVIYLFEHLGLDVVIIHVLYVDRAGQPGSAASARVSHQLIV